MRENIEATVPHGRAGWGQAPADASKAFAPLSRELDIIVDKTPKVERAAKRALTQMGTLGGGNHFVEICLDEREQVWIMLHSGSRGIGNAIGSRYIELAKADMKRHFIHLPDEDLAYLPEGTDHFNDYVQGGPLGAGVCALEPRGHAEPSAY